MFLRVFLTIRSIQSKNTEHLLSNELCSALTLATMFRKFSNIFYIIAPLENEHVYTHATLSPFILKDK